LPVSASRTWFDLFEEGNTVKLYADPISTTCRPILMLIEESRVPVEMHYVDLSKGAHKQPEFAAINPCRAVPALEDDDLCMTESSAILKYIADKFDSPAYPKDLKKRAQINAIMDWFNTGFYRDFGYNFVYPQIFPHHKRQHEIAQAATVDFGRAGTKKWLNILDKDFIGPKNKFLLGDDITIADYFGAEILGLADIVRCDLSPWPNVQRWLANMRALPSWNKVHEDYNNRLVQGTKDVPFIMF
jgi:glutathione S-transferase